jgi:arylsulfatase A-like enzyme
MNLRFVFLCILGMAIPAPSWADSPKPPPGKPNIVLVIGDDLGVGDIGCFGSVDIPTPHVDRLAKEGVRCTSGYVTASLCSPSRAAMLTGRYQQRFGIENNRPADTKGMGLDLKVETLADALRSVGYATGLVGKWHLGAVGPYRPFQRGFQEFAGYYGAFYPYFPKDMWHGETKKAESEYSTDAIARESCAFIQRHKDEPFFLKVAFNASHEILTAKPQVLEKLKEIKNERRRLFAAVTVSLDEAVGRIMDKLRELNLDERTLVIFISDNGAVLPAGSNGMLRGGKRSVYEGGVRVPFIWRWTGVLPAGKDYAESVSALDFFPTIATLARAKMPEKLDGVDVLPFLRGEKAGSPHERLFWKMDGKAAVRQGPWKLVLVSAMKKQPELYDLAADPGESKNVADQHSAVAAEMRRAYNAWNETLLPVLKVPGKDKK